MNFRFLIWLLAFAAFVSCQSKKEEAEKLDPSVYEILVAEPMTGMETCHIWYKGEDISEEKLKQFMRLFRAERPAVKLMICLYNDATLGNLVTKFPLEPEEYLRLADRFIAVSDHSLPNELLMYPLQDANYKALGGTNWKKQPVE